MAFVKRSKLLLLVLITAFLLRFLGIMPGISHPDEGILQIYSWDLFKNIASQGDFNPHIFKYGSINFFLHAAVSAPVFLAAYFIEIVNSLLTSSFSSQLLSYFQFHDSVVAKYSWFLFFAGRSLTVLFGVGCVYLAYIIGKELFNKRVGILSALFLALAPLAVRDSRYVTTDIPMLFFVFLSFYFLLLTARQKLYKWHFLAGFFLGLSATVKFFPIAFLAYPFALLFAFEKKKEFIFKIFLGLFAIFLGVFVGLPFIFLEPGGFSHFLGDLGKYALPWYGSSVSSYLVSLFAFLVSFGKTPLPSLSSLTLPAFQPFLLTFLIFNGFGILPFALSVGGMLTLLFKDFRKFILLLIIPLVNFIYVTSYMPVYYERLVLPTLGFLVFFAAYAFDRIPKKFAVIVILAVFVQPFIISFSSGLSCARPRIEKQSSKWIERNIAPGASIAYMPEITFPAIELEKLVRLQPHTEFSLNEVRELGVNYAFINAGKLDYYTYMYFLYYFPAAKEAFVNSHVFLSLSEYLSSAKLLTTVEKPLMCDNSRIFYFELPEDKTQPEKLVKDYKFNGSGEESWKVQTFADGDGAILSNVQNEGRNRKGALNFIQKEVKYTPPRVRSEKIPVAAGRAYSFSVWIKSEKVSGDELQRIFARLDYYNDGYEDLRDRVNSGLHKAVLLFNYGITPMYYERERLAEKDFSDTDLPGEVIALSPRIKPSGLWQRLEVRAKAPEDAKFAVLSLSSYTDDDLEMLIDDVEFREAD
ncbi:MAG: Glycosyl transferase family 39 [Candidatus Woesebacteria bacterium GW2011_GWB1_45_5]|uniref:Glycosyl transferase family 39 n=1 Tax=Candidatus Woesebacteria bacterium GW2011_GWB1_45_5 TaxID=1618581 RepID=A0A0G1QQL8_9BACT|nr:MAG: Glycosyl transferase family 39 [Candidatus Woesebacteria bacterium GW2011_GWB1_45_5]